MTTEKKTDIRVTINGEPITYYDTKGHSLTGPYLTIQMMDDTQYVYTMAKIDLLTITSK